MKKSTLPLLILLLCYMHKLSAQDADTIRYTAFNKGQDNTLFNVFPNPSEGTFQVVYGSSTQSPPPGWGGILTINIRNPVGKTVYTETILHFEGEYNRTIDLSMEEKGIYIVEIIIGKQKKIKREVLN